MRPASSRAGGAGGAVKYTQEEIQTALLRANENEKTELLALLEELERREHRERCQNDFLSFVKAMWPDFIEGDHHKKIADEFNKIAKGEQKRLIISLPPRHAIMTGMNIPTPAGWRTMGSLQVGDFVFGPDGQPTEILGKSEVFEGRQLYRVTTDDGYSIDVDGEHLWTVRLCRKHKLYTDYTTEQLYERQNGAMFRKGLDGVVKRQDVAPIDPTKVRLPRLPDWEPVAYPEKELLVDPYVLGVWLGDGAKDQGHITCCDEDAAIIRAEIERRGYITTDQKTRFLFGIKGLKVQLRELGVLGNKHIPVQYLLASPQQRRDLLKGLMDTDGCISKKGQCYFAQSNLAIINQVRTLLVSLGIKNTLSEAEAKIGDKSYGLTWRVYFYAKDIAFLPRKEERTAQTKKIFGRYIKIEKLNQLGDVQCIRVARPDGLFLAGDGFIVTHNTKSEFTSYLLPAWLMGQDPRRKAIQVSNTAELAEGFGRKVRDLMETDAYKEIFPDVEIKSDSRAAGRWNTNFQGSYYACGIGAALAGRGADIGLLDDVHTEQEALQAKVNPGIYDKVYEWYTTAIRQRLQPGGSIVICMTRWSMRDLIGQILERMNADEKIDKWRYIEFPAILPSGRALWPEYWPLPALEAIRAELPPAKWNAQYMQNPTSDETAIIKRDYWQMWEDDDPPKVQYIIMAMDTAFEAKQSADYSAAVIFGVWEDEASGEAVSKLILLNAWRGKLEFPELKAKTLELYKEWSPDSVIIEKKATGAPLIYELRRTGVPVQEFTPSRGNDKITRLNSIADIFASGMVWAPRKRWAEELIEELASFPSGRYDDFVDCCLEGETLILMGDGTEKTIKSVRAGDVVMTPYGPRTVVQQACTGVRPVFSVAGLVGTAEHPVFTARGWIPLFLLNPGDTILTVSTNRRLSWLREKIGRRYVSTGICIKNIVIDRILSGAEGVFYCIEMFGRRITGLCRRGGMSIISTATQVIIRLKISKPYRQENTERFTPQPSQSGQVHRNIWSIWRKSALWRRYGTLPKKAKNGIDSTRKILSITLTPLNRFRKWCQRIKHAKYAGACSYLKTLKDNTLVLKNAIIGIRMKREPAQDTRMPLLEIASIVRNHLSLSTVSNSSVVPIVSSVIEKPVSQKKHVAVYNLEIAEHPMFYANGVLVHNCSLALARFRAGGFVGTQHDKEYEDEVRNPYTRSRKYY